MDSMRRAGVFQTLPGSWHFEIMIGSWADEIRTRVITYSMLRYDTQQEALSAACEWLKEASAA